MTSSGTLDFVLLPDSGVQFLDLGQQILADRFVGMRGSWWPLPFLRDRDGPENWCRLWITPPADNARIILAFDTTVAASCQVDAAPCPDDVGRTEFRLAPDDAIATFLKRPMLDKWQPQLPDTEEFLGLVSALPVLRKCSVTLAAPANQPDIPVDLVVTLTTAHAMAWIVDGGVASPLILQDLARPHLHHEGEIPWAVEFSQADFGDRKGSRHSGRFDAFLWPSPVRIGSEAERLAALEWGKQWPTGSGFLLRHLENTSPHDPAWRINPGEGETAADDRGRLPVGSAFLNSFSDDTAPIDEGKNLARFSRATLVTFFFAELLAQAQGWVNAPTYRQYHPHRPATEANIRRHITNIRVIPPAGLHPRERKALFSAISDAVRHMWPLLHPGNAPEIVDAGDGAIIAQHRYTESDDRSFCISLFGQKRDNRQSLRLATLDLDLLWSSLTIATHSTAPDETRVELRQRFASGGYDVATRIIERLVLPKLAQQPGEGAKLKALFSARTTVAYWEARHRYTPAVMQALHDMKQAEARTTFSLPLSITVSLTARELDLIIREVLQEDIAQACTLVRQAQCDSLLLSGMAASWPTVLALVQTHMPVPPKRIVALSEHTPEWDDHHSAPTPTQSDGASFRESYATLAPGGIGDATFDLTEISPHSRRRRKSNVTG